MNTLMKSRVHSIQECVSKGGKIIEVEQNATSNYKVRIKMPDRSEKFFPNITQRSLQPFIKKTQQLRQNKAVTNISEVSTSEEETSEIRALKFLQAMYDDGVISEYHKNQQGNYVVRMRMPPEYLCESMADEIINSGDSFEQSMSDGGNITNFKKLESYSVCVKMPEGNIEQFENISQERLNKYKDRINSQPMDVHDSTVIYKNCKRNTFDAYMQQPGATIVEVRPYTFYSVHVKTLDDRIEYYPHISKEQFQLYQKEE
ncbi:hypothetical protein RclHR1_00760024 [Rhizophagus clarus]|uniref:Uncharacterized protein n=1 Tax=Rhizophagus clarus TaxID=94130 RepID=A0A2Z6RXT4_9GLOM|nr:hypothetical protein RclHR1_00760024 [Rhizophagus clarus]